MANLRAHSDPIAMTFPIWNRATIPAMLLLFGASLAAQTITETWSDQDSLFKEGIMVTTDGNDNTIATSFIWLDDIYTKKYAPDGTLLWEAVSSGPTFSVFERPYWVHADAADNVIVVGEK